VFIHVLKPKITYRTLTGEPQYEIVAIDGRRLLVHRLVAAAFHGPRPEGKIVHHKDHKKRNNKPDNLEYTTLSRNTWEAYQSGQIERKFSLHRKQQERILAMYATGKYRIVQLAKQFGVSRGVIRYLFRLAGVKSNNMKKLTPAIYEEIRQKWIPYEYPMSRLACEYGVSVGMIEYILGMHNSRGRRFPPVVKGRQMSTSDEELIALYKSGMKVTEISKKTGLVASRIYVRLRKHPVAKRHNLGAPRGTQALTKRESE
jgi:hypothetical protein